MTKAVVPECYDPRTFPAEASELAQTAQAPSTSARLPQV